MENTSIDESIFQIDEKLNETDAIKSYEWNEYHPTSWSNLNNSGTITINIESQDEFYHPRKCCLLIECELVNKAGGGRFGNEQITLANNHIMYIFSNLKYKIAG